MCLDIIVLVVVFWLVSSLFCYQWMFACFEYKPNPYDAIFLYPLVFGFWNSKYYEYPNSFYGYQLKLYVLIVTLLTGPILLIAFFLISFFEYLTVVITIIVKGLQNEVSSTQMGKTYKS